MAFDYKKAYKDLYLPPRQPHILDVPPMNFLAVRGHRRPQRRRRRLPGCPGTAVWCGLHHQDEQAGFPCHRGILRLCGTAPGGLMVTGGTDGP